MVKILHTADIHLKEKSDERWNALISILELAEDEEVDYLIISGDLFHKDANSDLIRHKMRDLFKDKEFEIIILPGNHDENSYPKNKHYGQNVRLLNEKPFQIIEEDKVRFIGLPFQNISRESLLDNLSKIEERIDKNKTNIYVFHGDLADVQFYRYDAGEDEEDKRYMPVRLEYFKGGDTDYVLAGHYHTNFNIHNLGSGFFVYPGSPVSTTQKETGKRKVNLFEIGDEPNEVEIDTFHYREVEVNLNPENEEHLDKIKEKLDSVSDDAKIVLKITGFIHGSEKEFDESLKDLKEDYPIEDIKSEYRDLKHITDTDLYKSFEERLGEENIDSETEELIRKYFMEASALATE